jgi:hypothetical protein
MKKIQFRLILSKKIDYNLMIVRNMFSWIISNQTSSENMKEIFEFRKIKPFLKCIPNYHHSILTWKKLQRPFVGSSLAMKHHFLPLPPQTEHGGWIWSRVSERMSWAESKKCLDLQILSIDLDGIVSKCFAKKMGILYQNVIHSIKNWYMIICFQWPRKFINSF